MKVQPFPADWSVRLSRKPQDAGPLPVALDQKIPATVPGCVHTDLLAAGLIEDPYPGLNEAATHWIGRCDWTYHTTLHIDAETLGQEQIDLVFEGLDTVATIKLNGQEVGRSENMHIRQRFAVKPTLRMGENDLAITFGSAIDYIEAMEAKIGPRPGLGEGSNPQIAHQMIRKMGCNFGWDWGPQLVTCGVWRPGRIEAWSGARLGDVRPGVTRADADLATLDVCVDYQLTGDAAGYRRRCRLMAPDGERVAQNEGSLSPEAVTLEVERPDLWWPIGYGDQPLYRLIVELLDESGHVIQDREHRVGLRTVQLITEPDPVAAYPPDTDESQVGGLTRGETFYLKINGKRVFCKGANWIPDDCFPHRVTPERYRQRIDQARAVHMNMLRVWGGGLYEDKAFYDICDEMGILVWQDFCLACACYPEEEPLRTLFEDEARDNVSRLSPHPSLVLWNGNNENIWFTVTMPDFEKVRAEGELTWGLGYYLDVFPKVVAELDPSRPYWPGSPYSGSMDRDPNANEFGNRHIWDVWNGQGRYRNYLGHFPRFASEFGFQGPPTWPTVCHSIPPQERSWLSETSHQHNKQKNGQQKGLDRIADSFELPESYDDQWFLASVNQARALTLGCEWFRVLSPWCSGALYWQLNDCWPVTSWSAIDGEGRPKLLWYATRRFFRPRLLTLKPAAITPGDTPLGAMAAYLHNDHDQAWSDQLTVSRMDMAGRVLDQIEQAIEVGPRQTLRVVLPASWTTHAGEFLLADTAKTARIDRAWWFFGEDREIVYPEQELDGRVTPVGDGRVDFTVTARGIVRDLCVFVDRIREAATAHEQLVNLLPGESFTFHLDHAKGFTLKQLTDPPVMRSTSLLSDAVSAS